MEGVGRWDSSFVEAGNLIPAELEAGHLMKVSTEGRRNGTEKDHRKTQTDCGPFTESATHMDWSRNSLVSAVQSQRPGQCRTVPNGCTVEMTHQELSDLPVALA